VSCWSQSSHSSRFLGCPPTHKLGRDTEGGCRRNLNKSGNLSGELQPRQTGEVIAKDDIPADRRELDRKATVRLVRRIEPEIDYRLSAPLQSKSRRP